MNMNVDETLYASLSSMQRMEKDIGMKLEIIPLVEKMIQERYTETFINYIRHKIIDSYTKLAIETYGENCSLRDAIHTMNTMCKATEIALCLNDEKFYNIKRADNE